MGIVYVSAARRRAVNTLKKAYASVNWPTTTGTITSSAVSGISDECSPSIWYEYSVNGKEYVNKEITTQQWNESMHKHHAEEIVAEYPVGSTVKVYYQNKNPSISYLVIGVSVTNWVLSIFFLRIDCLGNLGGQHMAGF